MTVAGLSFMLGVGVFFIRCFAKHMREDGARAATLKALADTRPDPPSSLTPRASSATRQLARARSPATYVRHRRLSRALAIVLLPATTAITSVKSAKATATAATVMTGGSVKISGATGNFFANQ